MAAPVEAGPSTGANSVRHCALDNFEVNFLGDDGRAVPLYNVRRDEDARRVDCFVEAEEGKAFSVYVVWLEWEARSFHVSLYLGGTWVKSYICEPGHWRLHLKARDIGMDAEQTFKFAKANLTDDDKRSIRDPAQAAKLCDVTVELAQLSRIVRVQGRYSGCDPAQPLVPDTAIFEKAKKVGAVGFAAGETSLSTASHPIAGLDYHLHSVVEPGVPPLVFNFRCVTRVGLQLMRLIPLDVDDPLAKARRKADEAAKRRREEEEMELESERLRKRLKEIETRKKAMEEAAQETSASSSRVKQEKLEFDFSSGGNSAENPLVLDSDEDSDEDGDEHSYEDAQEREADDLEGND